jgi:segregation and condensation protein A
MDIENTSLAIANESLITVAKVDGTTWQQFPEDLYIPPDALEVFVEIFEGPLDLLLYLIKKQNLDILNIPVAQITRQYMEYVELMQKLHLELAAEYLVMAASLAEIKSRMLLPRPAEVAEEEEDPRAFLVAKLKEYERMKKAAEDLDQLPRQERDIFPTKIELGEFTIKQYHPDVELPELLLAFKDVLKRVEQFTEHQITKEQLSLKDRMINVLELLKSSESLSFFSLFNFKEGRAGVVVAFLAILELSKEGLIEIFQPEPFAELKVKAALISAPI